MIDRKHIGRTFAPHTVDVEKGRLRFFAKATGQDYPVYVCEESARAAGYSSLPVPPTFLFSLNMEKPDPFETLDDLGIELANVLHGAQSFTYLKPVCAGDSLTFVTQVVDIFDKKGGALEFVVQKTNVTNQKGEKVAELGQTLVVRN